MSELVHASALMGTVVSIRVRGHGGTAAERREREERVQRAVAWFHEIERICSRFEPDSEVRRLSDRIGRPVPASPTLLSLVAFALAVAEDSEGAFDPTVGLQMEALGFDREYRSGRSVRTPLAADSDVSWRDVLLDPDAQTITLKRPLVLDLGAVAKGVAVDVAARELAPLENFTIDAGGDLFLSGSNESGEPWSVGIADPSDPARLVDTFLVSGLAVCTSGEYELGRHILDPRRGTPAEGLSSVTVVAPSAMVADALGTAAFVLGPREGLALLERHGVDGLLVTPSLERIETAGLRGLRRAASPDEVPAR